MAIKNSLPPTFVSAMKGRKAAVTFFQTHLANFHAAMNVFERDNPAAARVARDNYQEPLALFDTAYFEDHENATRIIADIIAAYESRDKALFNEALVNLGAARDRYKATVATARTALENARDVTSQTRDLRALDATANFDAALGAYAAAFDELGFGLDAMFSACSALP